MFVKGDGLICLDDFMELKDSGALTDLEAKMIGVFRLLSIQNQKDILRFAEVMVTKSQAFDGADS
ncbi:hypothetical protein [Pseudomonas sp. H1_D05]